MSNDFYIKRGDQGPSLMATLLDANDAPINLTTADTILFKMGATIDSAVVIVSAAAGTVRYDWDTGDTSRAGVFKAEFEIEWNDGRKQTVPNDGYININIDKDLG